MTDVRASTAVPRLRPPTTAVAAGVVVVAVATACVLHVSFAVYLTDAVALLTSTAAAGLALFTTVFGAPGAYADRWRDGARRLAVVGFAATLASVLFAVADVAGTGVSGISDTTAGDAVLRGGIYQSGLARCVGLCAIAFAFSLPRPRPWLLLTAAVVTCGSWLFTGHVRDHGPAVLVVVCALAHVIAAAAWLGGLVGIALVLRKGGDDIVDRTRLLMSFAGVMTGVVAMLLAGGVGLALLYLRTPSALVTTAYGQVLIVKAGLVAATLAVSATNHRRLVPLAARGDRPALAVLRVNIAVEQIAIVTVLLITEILMRQNPGAG